MKSHQNQTWKPALMACFYAHEHAWARVMYSNGSSNFASAFAEPSHVYAHGQRIAFNYSVHVFLQPIQPYICPVSGSVPYQCNLEQMQQNELNKIA